MTRNQLKTIAALTPPAGREASAWITSKLVADTLHTWQPFYRERLTEADAVAILENVGGLFDVLEHSP